MFKDITMTYYIITALVFQMVKQMQYVNEKKKRGGALNQHFESAVIL